MTLRIILGFLPPVFRWHSRLGKSVGNALFYVVLFSAIAGMVGMPWTNAAEIDASKLPPPAKDNVDYERDVKPLLATHCVRCHGPKKQMGDLRLDTRTALLKGGSRGSTVVEKTSAKSLLIEAVSQLNPDSAMPPEGEPLSDHEVGILRAWIDQGTVGPDDAAQSEKPLPWSFHPVRRPDLPSAPNSIDTLIAQRQHDKGLTFSPEADRRTLIRRLYLVMHGLPPTPQQVDAFVRDGRPNAYELLVDEVLASPRYGERWGRHWLDVVRFAESNGFETNRVRENAWPYRDYVIAAFNDDKPYDQFVREQLAGDTLGVDSATGFLVAGAYDIVKSPDVTLTLMQRQDELADIINTTGTAFLGLTLGCARCHDHKFDPVSQVEFYSLQAIFAGVGFGPRNLPPKIGPEKQRDLALLQATLQQEEATLNGFRELARQVRGQKKLRPAVNPHLNEDKFAQVTASSVRFTIKETLGKSQPCIDELEIYDTNGTNVALASAGSVARVSGTLPGYEIHKQEHVNDGRIGNNRSWISNESNTGWIEIRFPKAIQIERIVWSRDRNENGFKDRVPTDYLIEVSSVPDEWQTVASSKDRESGVANDPNAFVKHLPAEAAQRAQEILDRIAKNRAHVAELTQGLPAWLGTFAQPSETYRLHRGDPQLKREAVVPGAVAALGRLELRADEPERDRRRKLADWITRADHPLTSRVIANRVWHYIFGTGLVETPSDFGANGVPPTHPELLDWLADELATHRWSLKHLQKQILLSRTFRQASDLNAHGQSIDADSRYLWRYPHRRIEAEAMRDCILAVTGKLDLTMGGPGFFLQIVEVDNVYRYFPKEEVGPKEFRRMVYLNRIRQEQDPVFGAFDCPSGNQVIPRRSRSNTPLQALNLFNSPFMIQQAGFLAERLRADAGSESQDQVRLAFRLVTGREPDAEELAESEAIIKQHGLAAFCRAMLNLSEFLFVF